MKGKIFVFIGSAILVWIIGGWLWGSWWIESDFISNFHGTLDGNSYKDIAVEFHGMVFDIILFGLVLTFYEWMTDRRDKINRYREEIDDYLGWESDEAMYRIVGNIKRLNRLKVNKIKLERANLKRASLWKTNLKESELSYSNLEGAQLGGVDMENAILQGAKLIRTALPDVNLKSANLQYANLEKAGLLGTNLTEANLADVNLENATLFNANLAGANLRRVNFKGAQLWSVNLKGANLLDANLEEAILGTDNLEIAESEWKMINPIVFQSFKDNPDLFKVELEGAKAYEYQKLLFSKVLSSKQISLIDWKENPDEYEPENEEKDEIDSILSIPKCTALTKQGTPCKIPPKKGKDRCHIHSK